MERTGLGKWISLRGEMVENVKTMAISDEGPLVTAGGQILHKKQIVF